MRNETLSVVHLVMLRYADMALELLKEETSVPTRNVLKLLTELDDVAIVCHLRHRGSETPVVVATTHLHYNPINPHLKAMQCSLLLDALHGHLAKWGLDPDKTHVVLAGDLNSLPKKTHPDEFDPILPPGGLVSGVYELITEGSLPQSHLDHPHARDPEICKGVPPLKSSLRLRSAMRVACGSEPLLTTKTADFCGTLDYVFVNHPGAVLRVLDMPPQNEEEARAFPPIPDGANWPSDHLPLVVDIAVAPLYQPRTSFQMRNSLELTSPSGMTVDPAGEMRGGEAPPRPRPRDGGKAKDKGGSPRAEGGAKEGKRGSGEVSRSRSHRKRSGKDRGRINTL